MLAPRQATFQIERSLLGRGQVTGYTRLHVLSFERLARFLHEEFKRPLPELLSEQGRVMVLRALLNSRADDLLIFKNCAARKGFAEELSLQIREFQTRRICPGEIREWAAESESAILRQKLSDIALLFEAYQAWLKEKGLKDVDALIGCAADLLEAERENPALKVAAIYVDGFAQFTPEERRLLFNLIPRCAGATIALCMVGEDTPDGAISTWGNLRKTLLECKAAAKDIDFKVEVISRDESRSRYATSPSLAHLERCWNSPVAFSGALDVSVWECPDPNAEAIFCAREIIRHVRSGGRFRDVAILARNFDNEYPHLLRMTFKRYGIPYFLDHRENVAHHPLAELTRGALRTIAYGWKLKDWFSVLKSGMIPMWRKDTKASFNPDMLDELENAALEHGWEGDAWKSGFKLSDKEKEAYLNKTRKYLVEPFIGFEKALGNSATGDDLAEALIKLWSTLAVEEQLIEHSTNGNDAVHDTVWNQANEWLENLKLAFGGQKRTVQEWISIVEAGLQSLTVGVIPPVLDQVLIGAVDRSRNPDLKKVIILGLNEGIFPVTPNMRGLLSEHDLEALANRGKALFKRPVDHISEEQFFGYIACTRPREKLILTCSASAVDGKKLNQSRFIPHLQRLFPQLEVKSWSPPELLQDPVHLCELGPLATGLCLEEPDPNEMLSPEVTDKLYGRDLKVSVSSMERFAMCPFRFFLEKGLRVHERMEFELGIREQGSFQHEVLSKFHLELKAENKKWRVLRAEEAVRRIGRIADEVIETFNDGLLTATEENAFTGECYKKALQEFIEAVYSWFDFNEFDPEYVELPFGGDREMAGWRIPLSNQRSLVLKGRIDRVDLYREEDGRVYYIIHDYKSGIKKLEQVFVQHGVQQQLTAYLGALLNIEEAKEKFNAKEMIPAGCFLIPLRPTKGSARSRSEALSRNEKEARARAYTHSGLFDLDLIDRLDSKNEEEKSGQFSYRLTNGKLPYKGSFSALTPEGFKDVVINAETILKETGEKIFSGNIAIHPYRSGNKTACDQCDFGPVCRFDPWTQKYNILQKLDK